MNTIRTFLKLKCHLVKSELMNITMNEVFGGGKCKMILSKGKRKNEFCNRKIEDGTTCKVHIGKEFQQKCGVILTKGSRKNQVCDKKILDGGKICKMHQTLEDNKPYNPYMENEYNVKILPSQKMVTSEYCVYVFSELNEQIVYKLNNLN